MNIDANAICGIPPTLIARLRAAETRVWEEQKAHLLARRQVHGMGMTDLQWSHFLTIKRRNIANAQNDLDDIHREIAELERKAREAA